MPVGVLVRARRVVVVDAGGARPPIALSSSLCGTVKQSATHNKRDDLLGLRVLAILNAILLPSLAGVGAAPGARSSSDEKS
jgi:hypothetical protein